MQVEQACLPGQQGMRDGSGLTVKSPVESIDKASSTLRSFMDSYVIPNSDPGLKGPRRR